jgi:hypothetical protein
MSKINFETAGFLARCLMSGDDHGPKFTEAGRSKHVCESHFSRHEVGVDNGLNTIPHPLLIDRNDSRRASR